MTPDPTTDTMVHLRADEGRSVDRLNGEQTDWIDDEERLLAKVGGERSRVDEATLRAVHDRYGLEILGPPPDWDDRPTVAP